MSDNGLLSANAPHLHRWHLVAGAIAALTLLAMTPSAGAQIFTPLTLPSNPASEVLPPSMTRPLPTPTSRAASLAAAVDQCVGAAMANAHSPGAAAAVAIDGQLVYEQGYGVKRRGASDPVGPGTQFRIGSITKMMTAAAVLQQVEAGRVALTDPALDHIPELQVSEGWPVAAITVEDLLRQSSGYPDSVFFIDGPTGENALADWAGNQNHIRLHAPAGTLWNYSNPNFALAGLVAERSAATPYQRLVVEQVWTPAGMADTTFDPALVIARGDFSYGHDVTTYAPDDYDHHAAAPAGYAFSTAADLVNWALLLMGGGGAVLSPESAAAMQAPQFWMGYTPELWYGFGVFIESYRGLDLRQHGGNIPGWGAYLLWVPERRFAVAVLANTTQSLGEAAYCVVDAVLQPTGDSPSYPPSASETWDAFLGTYKVLTRLGQALSAEVRRTGPEGLEISFASQSGLTLLTSPLEPLFLDTFLFDGDGDGTVESDLSFLERPYTNLSRTWARNRGLVGELPQFGLDPRTALPPEE